MLLPFNLIFRAKMVDGLTKRNCEMAQKRQRWWEDKINAKYNSNYWKRESERFSASLLIPASLLFSPLKHLWVCQIIFGSVISLRLFSEWRKGGSSWEYLMSPWFFFWKRRHMKCFVSPLWGIFEALFSFLVLNEGVREFFFWCKPPN